MTTSRRHPNVVNVEEIEALDMTGSKRFASRMRMLGAAAGGQALGCTWYEVPPGKSAFPRHAHTANEEAMFVLEGAGRLRIGDAEVQVRAGDFVALPAGKAHAHQVLNEGEGPLRYLCWSTKAMPDVVFFPDSGKVGYTAPGTPGDPASPPIEQGMFRERDSVGFLDDEDGG